MALPTILNPLATLEGWTELEQDHGVEMSMQGGGTVRTAELRAPLWRFMFQSRPADLPTHKAWCALVDPLLGGNRLFYAYDLSGVFPIAYPAGDWPTGGSFDGLSAAVHTVGTGGTSMRLKNLPVGYAVSIGDLISVTFSASKLALVRAMEVATADGSGITPTFEVRPALRPGVAADDVVAVKRPAFTAIVVPGSFSAPIDRNSATGTLSFQGLQAGL